MLLSGTFLYYGVAGESKPPADDSVHPQSQVSAPISDTDKKNEGGQDVRLDIVQGGGSTPTPSNNENAGQEEFGNEARGENEAQNIAQPTTR